MRLVDLSLSVTMMGAVACGASPSPPAAPVTSAPASTAPPPSDAPSSAVARPIGVAVSQKSDNYTIVTISFENHGKAACTITGYVLSWPGGSKAFTLEGLQLAPGESKTRGARVHREDGDITTLTGADMAKVELRSSCR